MRKQSDKTNTLTCKSCFFYNGNSNSLCAKWILPIGRNNKICGYFKKTLTCGECNNFYEREEKPWRTNPDLGYCDHSIYNNEETIEVNRNCPANKWCDNKFEPR